MAGAVVAPEITPKLAKGPKFETIGYVTTNATFNGMPITITATEGNPAHWYVLTHDGPYRIYSQD